jgi:glucose dehydrogenase
MGTPKGRKGNPESNVPLVKKSAPKMLRPQGRPDPFKPPYARLSAIDLNTGEMLWQGRRARGIRREDPPRVRQEDRIVWEMLLPGDVSNSPMTYMVNGKQYIVVAVSGREFLGELVALALP